MKIEREFVERTTIEEFADKHGLVMEVRERKCVRDRSDRFYAHFKGSEIKPSRDGVGLYGVSGDGPTEEEAIKDYAREIQGRLLVIDAMLPTRREIDVPMLDGHEAEKGE